MAAAEDGLGLKPGQLTERCKDAASEIRMNHYPSISIEKFLDGRVGGLKLEDRSKPGTFVPVIPIGPGRNREMVVNTSNTFQRWINDVIRASLHQVTTPPWHSCVFFFKASRDTSVGPLPHLESDVFGKLKSPSVFVVYAHENEKEGITANSWCVVRLIGWLKAIRSRPVYDKAPLRLWAPRAGGSDSIRNILSHQFCLLAGGDDISSNIGTINCVDKVVVCGSEVLRRYYQNAFTPLYIETVVSTYVEAARNESTDPHALEQKIRSIVETNC
ncbi:hypothetical protein F4824DRAFT_506772 [Ustulina deusta]|nr:hypothetical protein F4824DRAFT_506772 [Ustulina deusta]